METTRCCDCYSDRPAPDDLYPFTMEWTMNGHYRAILIGLLLPMLTLFSACGTSPIDPGAFTGKAGGCGNFQVYAFNQDLTDAIVVNARAGDLALDRTPRGFVLPNPALDVRVDRFPSPADQTYYCNDYGSDVNPIRTWNAVSGIVLLAVGDTLDVQPWETRYNVKVVLRDAVLRDRTGNEVFIEEFDFGEIAVGWLPG